MPVEVYSKSRENIASYYGYKFKINYIEGYIEFETKDVIYFDTVSIQSGINNTTYMEVICK